MNREKGMGFAAWPVVCVKKKKGVLAAGKAPVRKKNGAALMSVPKAERWRGAGNVKNSPARPRCCKAFGPRLLWGISANSVWKK